MLLAREVYRTRDLSPTGVLADAPEESGCDNEDVLNHCRAAGIHVRGCHVVDLVLDLK